jgi:isopropylmalate/homocitrate/citramalate synthase
VSDRRPVELIEVAPRDGLQNEPVSVSLSDKAELVRRLVACGFRRIEVTSFVSPTAVPQLADADQLLPLLPSEPEVEYISLVPNERGYDRAVAAGARHVEVFTAATDAFCRANIRCTIDESFDRFEQVMRRASHDGVSVRGAVSVAFHCPYSGPVAPENAVAVAERLLAAGCNEVAIADTIGRATPDETDRLLEIAIRRLPVEQVALHFHDTTGQAVENIRHGWDAGVAKFDASAGGLGGCPFAPGAPGNVASEHVVEAFEAAGIATGIDIAALSETGSWIRSILGNS